jgi:hypothetical protein
MKNPAFLARNQLLTRHCTSGYLLSARPRPRLAPVTVTTFPEKGSGLTAYGREAVMSPIIGLGEVARRVLTLSFGGKVQPKHF